MHSQSSSSNAREPVRNSAYRAAAFTINLRNPFRRDGTRPPLRQRAASLKAAAARAIRGEAPSLGAVDPTLARLEAEFRAAAADYYAADTAIGAVHETYEEPPMSADLRVSRLDWIEHSIPRADTRLMGGGRMLFLPYDARHVEELRRRRHMMSVPGLGDQRPNPRAQELCGRMGDAVWVKAAYRGGCRACQDLSLRAIRRGQPYQHRAASSA